MKTLRDAVTEKLQIVFEHMLNYEGEYVFSVNGMILLVPKEVDDIKSDFIISSFINVKENNKVEFLIKDDGNIGSREFDFSDSKYTFKVNNISDIMSIKLLLALPDKRYRFTIPPRIILERLTVTQENIFEFLKATFRHYYSLIIENNIDDNLADFEKLAKSALFNISMSSGLNFYLVKNLDEDDDNMRLSRLHGRSLPNVPHLIYDDEMVQYYMAGRSARIPKVQYLSYYNVLEFWFDKKYNDEKCQEIQRIVTNPKFNHKNLKNYKKIIDIFRLNKNRASELEMLQSLIEQYIIVCDFKIFLNNNDYYTKNSAHKIDDTKFSLADSDALLKKKLSKRIYKVRNAIVHSKESDEEKYFPQDEKYILYEVDLVKYVAEQVIIGAATVI